MNGMSDMSSMDGISSANGMSGMAGTSLQQDDMPRSRWMGALRFMVVWVVLMLLCAHLALVIAQESPHSCDAGQSSPRLRGTRPSPAQMAVDGASSLQKKVRDVYSAVFVPCARHGGRA
jgi:hypothetical protein